MGCQNFQWVFYLRGSRDQWRVHPSFLVCIRYGLLKGFRFGLELGVGVRSNTRIHLHCQSSFWVGDRRECILLLPVFNRINIRRFQTAKIRSKHGIILDCACSLSVADNSVSSISAIQPGVVDSLDPQLKDIERALLNRRYGFVSAMEILNSLSINGVDDETGSGVRAAKDIALWLERTMNS